MTSLYDLARHRGIPVELLLECLGGCGVDTRHLLSRSIGVAALERRVYYCTDCSYGRKKDE